jgi:hypothetical protein
MQYIVNRSPYASEHRVLSGNALKIIAAVAMTLDHVAVHLLPDRMAMLQLIFRIIGRLAFPIFAYCLAEGCRYSKKPWKRFLIILGGGLIFETVWVTLQIIGAGGDFLSSQGDLFSLIQYIRLHFLEGNVFLTLACSVLLIHIMQICKQKLAEKDWAKAGLMALVFLATAVILFFFDNLMNGLQYGYAGILLPVTVAFTDYDKNKAPEIFRKLDHPMIRLAFFALGLVVMVSRSSMKVVQTFGLLSLIPLALYNGKPGSAKLKWWFYAFYPAHLVVIWLIGLLIK